MSEVSDDTTYDILMKSNTMKHIEMYSLYQIFLLDMFWVIVLVARILMEIAEYGNSHSEKWKTILYLFWLPAMLDTSRIFFWYDSMNHF